MARVLTGIQSTGTPHLGNVLGAMKPAIAMADEVKNDAFLFIADFHSLTQIKDAELLKNNTYSVAAAWIALGFDYEKNTFYRQSMVPEVAELTWYLNCFTPYPMLAQAHSFKDKSNRLADVNAGLFTYPVLMAADIILYDAEVVPVGKDQVQHLEMTRDIAGSFNHQLGDTFVIPDTKVQEGMMYVPGTDGQKMSKSYGNTITLFQSDKKLKKDVMGIVTDSIPLEDPKDPDACNVYNLYKLIASTEKVKEMKENYEAGGYGYGHAKTALLNELKEQFGEAREKFDHLMNNTDELEEILKVGEDKARIVARETLGRVREKCGYRKQV